MTPPDAPDASRETCPECGGSGRIAPVLVSPDVPPSRVDYALKAAELVLDDYRRGVPVNPGLASETVNALACRLREYRERELASPPSISGRASERAPDDEIPAWVLDFSYDDSGNVVYHRHRPNEHKRNCSARSPGFSCECSLTARQAIYDLCGRLGTERSMHNAWRKRAEEAEAELTARRGETERLRAALEEIKVACDAGMRINVGARHIAGRIRDIIKAATSEETR
jgi:hypothetical protein